MFFSFILFVIAPLIEQRHNVLEQQAAVDALVARVSVGEVVADVAQGGSAQQRVAQGMDGDVGVAVAQQPLLPGDVHAAQPQFTPLDEAVNVKTHSYTHHNPQQYLL